MNNRVQPGARNGILIIWLLCWCSWPVLCFRRYFLRQFLFMQLWAQSFVLPACHVQRWTA